MNDGVLYINGKAVERERVDDFVATDAIGSRERAALPRDAAERRQLPDPRPRAERLEDNTPVYEVPPGPLSS